MLNMIKIKLRLITDPGMYVFFEKGMRGGASYISNRYNKANNKHLKSYDPKKESKHIIYIDGKRLLQELDLNKYTSNSSRKCVLEVDLGYPKELQELHNDYSLAPDKIEIKREMLSNYQLRVSYLYNIPLGTVKKLVPNFFD